MKLNLGCGSDIRDGYLNVDVRFPESQLPPDVYWNVDLSKFPYPWKDCSVDEILMLDFLEHFPYRQTDQILEEAWRLLVPGTGFVDIQVPSFEVCAIHLLRIRPFWCNDCFYMFEQQPKPEEEKGCPRCKRSFEDISFSAVKRLYGGQGHPGDFHQVCFTKGDLQARLRKAGFDRLEDLEIEHQAREWNYKIRAHKAEDPWK